LVVVVIVVKPASVVGSDSLAAAAYKYLNCCYYIYNPIDRSFGVSV